MTNINEQLRIIRDFINSPRKHQPLFESTIWNMLCSSLDAIGDTELAIRAYQEINPKSAGEKYLVIYGILQVLVVQQDATLHLAESLNLKYELSPLLESIRYVRHDSIGHPTKRDFKKIVSYGFINRGSISAGGFGLTKKYADKTKMEVKNVNIPKLINNQQAELSKLLSQVIQALRDEESSHRNKFKDEKLVKIFNHSFYYCEKMCQASDDYRLKSIGLGAIEMIEKNIADFKDALARRGLANLESVNYRCDEIAYPLDRLKAYFSDSSASGINEKDARIYIYFIRTHLQELEGIAEEIDAEYQIEV